MKGKKSAQPILIIPMLVTAMLRMLQCDRKKTTAERFLHFVGSYFLHCLCLLESAQFFVSYFFCFSREFFLVLFRFCFLSFSLFLSPDCSDPIKTKQIEKQKNSKTN